MPYGITFAVRVFRLATPRHWANFLGRSCLLSFRDWIRWKRTRLLPFMRAVSHSGAGKMRRVGGYIPVNATETMRVELARTLLVQAITLLDAADLPIAAAHVDEALTGVTEHLAQLVPFGGQSLSFRATSRAYPHEL